MNSSLSGPRSQSAEGMGPKQRAERPASAEFDAAAGPVNWRKVYARRVFLTDLLALIWVVYGTQITWLGFDAAQLAGFDQLSYWAFSAILIVAWMAALTLADTRTDRVIGTGNAEYVRVVDASVRLFGVIAIVAFLFRIDPARGFLLISLPLGVAIIIVVRWLWRQWLVAKRATGQYCARVLLVGSATSITQISRELSRTPDAGYRVIGACLSGATIGSTVPGTNVRVMGNIETIEQALLETHADTVVITSTGDLPPNKIKHLSWQLEAGRHHLVLAPSLTDIAGPRIHTRPVAGLPLIHVETPRFTAGQRFVKRTFDIVASLLLVLLLSPVLLVVAALVKTTSRGPVLFRHERVGTNGVPFRMLKFRSMRKGAARELPALLAAQGRQSVPLFKLLDDPRITPVGHFLRKYSLDELPQLFNVLAGTMSLVGPRPQVAAEVALYNDAARRRLLARPGITGLWQVSGRSTLGWEDAVRLDLYYVENWSLMSDIAILAKTVKAVFAPGDTAH